MQYGEHFGHSCKHTGANQSFFLWFLFFWLGWQWIFILEGLPTVLLTIVVFFYLPDYPETASFLSEDERDLAVRRLLADAGPATETEFSWKQFRDVFVDLKVYLHMIPYILTMTPLYALALFLPTLVREFSFE